MRTGTQKLPRGIICDAKPCCFSFFRFPAFRLPVGCRTQISQPILSILDDDGFDRIPSEREVRPGDIVIYSDARGEVSHSGFVVWQKKIELVGGIQSIIPMVWSKWGKGYEMIHAVGECPYLEAEGDIYTYYRLKRWTPTAQSKDPRSVLAI